MEEIQIIEPKIVEKTQPKKTEVTSQFKKFQEILKRAKNAQQGLAKVQKKIDLVQKTMSKCYEISANKAQRNFSKMSQTNVEFGSIKLQLLKLQFGLELEAKH